MRIAFGVVISAALFGPLAASPFGARAQEADGATPPAHATSAHRADPHRTRAPILHASGLRAPALRAPVVEATGAVHPAHPSTAVKQDAPGQTSAKPVEPASPPHPPAPPVDESKGSVTGLPLPRWASLRPDEVNLRIGPGTRYEIQWVYKRRDLPVRILREYGPWRLVEDQDLIKGWVHSATLIGHRDLVVTGQERTLRDAAHDGAGPVAMLKPGVIGHIRACEAASNWCEVQVGDYRGYLKRDEFWGTVPGEAVP